MGVVLPPRCWRVCSFVGHFFFFFTSHETITIYTASSLPNSPRRLISQMAKEIYNCEGGKVTKIQGSIEGFKAQLSRKLEAASEKFERDRRASKASGGGSVF